MNAITKTMLFTKRAIAAFCIFKEVKVYKRGNQPKTRAKSSVPEFAGMRIKERTEEQR